MPEKAVLQIYGARQKPVPHLHKKPWHRVQNIFPAKNINNTSFQVSVTAQQVKQPALFTALFFKTKKKFSQNSIWHSWNCWRQFLAHLQSRYVSCLSNCMSRMEYTALYIDFQDIAFHRCQHCEREDYTVCLIKWPSTAWYGNIQKRNKNKTFFAHCSHLVAWGHFTLAFIIVQSVQWLVI